MDGSRVPLVMHMLTEKPHIVAKGALWIGTSATTGTPIARMKGLHDDPSEDELEVGRRMEVEIAPGVDMALVIAMLVAFNA